MRSRSRKILLNLPDDFHDAVKDCAEKQFISVSEFTRNALREYMRKYAQALQLRLPPCMEDFNTW